MSKHGVLREMNLDLFVDTPLWVNIDHPILDLILKSSITENIRLYKTHG